MAREGRTFVALLLVLGFAGAPWAWAGDGVVALQTADPSCPVGAGYYFNCGNGTVTDLRTGLVWLRDAECFSGMNWVDAMATVSGLSDLDCDGTEGVECDCGLEDGSSPGEWRLPSRKEWKAMVADAVSSGCLGPSLTADIGAPCWSPGCVTTGGCSFLNVPFDNEGSWYWSSSTHTLDPRDAWWVNLYAGDVDFDSKTGSNLRVWPVRGGQ